MSKNPEHVATTRVMRLFAQIAKVDATKREVWGVATAEIVDKEGEIFDYKTSKPFFEKWSNEISKATDGKSLGNVREMHEPSAVGKLIDITFDDDMKQIRIGSKIVDDIAWTKCMEGVYTGFSIGGAYVKAWKDGEYVRFTANPVEISVVDNPCVPSAHFTAVKADGTSEVRKFAEKAIGHSPTQDKNTVEPVKKDMISVGDFSYVLANISCIQEWLESEAIWEGDKSPLPAKIDAWLKQGVALLRALVDEEGAELTDGEKLIRAWVKKTLGKKGAKHSASTKAHHEAIKKCMDGVLKCVDDAQQHLAELGKDDVAASATANVTKVSAATPQIHEGDTEMLDAKEKEQLDKAAADSATALTQITEITKKLDTVMDVLNKFVKAVAGEPEGVQKVSRTVVPTAAITVSKEQDGVHVEPVVPDLTREEIAKLSQGERDARFAKMASAALQKPRAVTHTPGRGGL
jgi:hypothetical protein